MVVRVRMILHRRVSSGIFRFWSTLNYFPSHSLVLSHSLSSLRLTLKTRVSPFEHLVRRNKRPCGIVAQTETETANSSCWVTCGLELSALQLYQNARTLGNQLNTACNRNDTRRAQVSSVVVVYVRRCAAAASRSN